MDPLATDKHGNPAGFRNRKIVSTTADGKYNEIIVPAGTQCKCVMVQCHSGAATFTNIEEGTEFHVKDLEADTAFAAFTSGYVEPVIKEAGDSLGWFKAEADKKIVFIYYW